MQKAGCDEEERSRKEDEEIEGRGQRKVKKENTKNIRMRRRRRIKERKAAGFSVHGAADAPLTMTHSSISPNLPIFRRS